MRLLVVDAPQPCRACLQRANLGTGVTTIGPLQDNLATAIAWLNETAARQRTIVLHVRPRDARFGAAFDRLVESAGATPVVLVPAAGSAHGAHASAANPTACLTCRTLTQGGLGSFTSEAPARPASTPAPAPSVPPPAPANAEAGDAGDDDRTMLARLSRRQRDVLGLLGQGYSNKEIARILGISYITVRVHVSAVMRSLEVANRTQAALIAAGAGDLVDTSRRRAARARSAA
jgi:DNA-binding NarL/FixJ family response regulator